ncbi:MAG: type II toxin-antitoxin system VapC family toxin [Nitrososphaerales archaeon]
MSLHLKVFLDANLLIYLNTQEDGENERTRLEDFYSDLLKEDLFTDLLVLEEAIYISLSKYHVPYSLTFELLKSTILPYASIIPMEEQDLVATEKYLSKYKVKPSDAIHLAVMEKKGIAAIASEDEEFDKVRGIKRMWIKRPKSS